MHVALFDDLQSMFFDDLQCMLFDDLQSMLFNDFKCMLFDDLQCMLFDDLQSMLFDDLQSMFLDEGPNNMADIHDRDNSSDLTYLVRLQKITLISHYTSSSVKASYDSWR
ncbi:hypothetical protein CHS0354_030554 [Potamilus streckersoni]|uniref:Uncharacterized protein n=1 Tax=Potamilus streckersoni TaxID=2493646 RepID=A0AAE0RPC4_9BIVA|nr:hypothetical protein CHS0354_030554 [Potamilus streckersoni]